MQANGETDPDTCQFNDLALVRLHPDDRDDVNPSIPHWGGPVGLATLGTAIGDQVYSYGNSSLRFGLDVLKPKTGISVGDAGNSWSHNVYTVTPGIPGDSGSAFLDPDGNALGVLSTLQVAPLVGSNGVGDVALELQYLNDNTGLDVELALGTGGSRGWRSGRDEVGVRVARDRVGRDHAVAAGDRNRRAVEEECHAADARLRGERVDDLSDREHLAGRRLGRELGPEVDLRDPPGEVDVEHELVAERGAEVALLGRSRQLVDELGERRSLLDPPDRRVDQLVTADEEELGIHSDGCRRRGRRLRIEETERDVLGVRDLRAVVGGNSACPNE